MEHETQHHTATFEKINATLDRITEMQEASRSGDGRAGRKETADRQPTNG